MPTFYTKTISSILEPVAQQVSLLVILHEEAESGVIIPDLKSPIGVVKAAVMNLTEIGSQTYKSSKDEILKRDMPPALKRVEEASEDLEVAANILSSDKTSLTARKKLIDGSRGILQGTSSVLVVYDMSEVRKIIKTCNNVKLFMNHIETVHGMDHLANFIKNLTPQLTSMTKMTLARADELTVKAHADILVQSVDQIKQCTSLLLSSLKMLIINNDNQNNIDQSSSDECKINRNDSVFKLIGHIQEIIRVLELTGENESGWWENDHYNIIRQCKTTIVSRSGLIDQWICSWQYSNSSLYDAAVKDLIDNLQNISDNCSDPLLRNKIKANATELRLMSDKITELRKRGEGNNPIALNLKQQFQHKYEEAQFLCEDALTKIVSDSAMKLPRSIDGRFAQAQLWLTNPEGQDRHVGVLACKSLVEDGNQMINALRSCSKNRKLLDSLSQYCNSVDGKTNSLNNLCIQSKCKSSEGYQLTHELLRDLTLLRENLSAAVIDQVTENFVDLKSAIRRLSESANANKNIPNRVEAFNRAAIEFVQQASAICCTANLVASQVSDGQQTAALKLLTDEVNHLTSQVVSAGKVVLMNKGDGCPQPIRDHFNTLKNDWENKVEKMTTEIDKFTDIGAFVLAQECAIEIESEKMEDSIRNCSPPGIVEGTSNIARRANRIAQKADVELSQNEDPLYVENLERTVTQLRHTITPMAMTAKNLMINLNDQTAINEWRKQNNNLREAVKSVKLTVSPLIETNISESLQSVSLTSTESTRDSDGDDHFDFPAAQPNQPILAAAHVLHRETRQWSSKDNQIIAAAKRMANLMAKLSQLVRGENGSKRELIDVAREIAQASEEVTKFARKLGEACTDVRIKNNLLQVCDRIPTIGTQLRILSTVKATMLGTQEDNYAISDNFTTVTQEESELNCGSDEDQEATEMLVGNAQNLMQSVIETVHAAEAASIKLRIDSGYSIKWCKRIPGFETK